MSTVPTTTETPTTVITPSDNTITDMTIFASGDDETMSGSGDNEAMSGSGDNETMSGSITIGAIIGAAVAVTIVATLILCIVILMKKNRKRKSSVDLTSGSEKSPNRDGYVNALYDSKSKIILTLKSIKSIQSIRSVYRGTTYRFGNWVVPTRAVLVNLLAKTHTTTMRSVEYSMVCETMYVYIKGSTRYLQYVCTVACY